MSHSPILSQARKGEVAPASDTRSSVYCELRPVSERDLRLMWRLDELDLEAPYYGARKAQQAAAPGGTRGRSPAWGSRRCTAAAAQDPASVAIILDGKGR